MQPNVITLTKFFGCDLMMQKIITTLSLIFQDSVNFNIDRKRDIQLSMFEVKGDFVFIEIPYSLLIKEPSNYKLVRNALRKLTTTRVEIPYKNLDTGEDRIRITGLLRVDMPSKPNYSKKIIIDMERRVVERFIQIDLDENGPVRFTKFLYEVTQNATSKYTAPIYKILASWRSKGIYKVRLNELKEILCIPQNSYSELSDFKKRIIMPVQKDLFERADLWFNCKKKGFTEVKNNEIWLNFKLITPLISEQENNKRQHLKNSLINYGFTDRQLGEIANLLNDVNISSEYIWRLVSQIDEKIVSNNSDRTKDKIINRPAYMVTSLINHFKN